MEEKEFALDLAAIDRDQQISRPATGICRSTPPSITVMFNPAMARPVHHYPAAVPPPFHHHAAGAMLPPPPPFHHAAGALPPPPPPPFGVPVRTVWSHNLDAELGVLRRFAWRARYAAVNVQYPGVVVHGAAAGQQQDPAAPAADERYAVIKANVDALKPLQVGLAIGTDDGRVLAWEFNLSGFDAAADPHAARSVEYLAGRGMDLDAHRLHGVPAARLASELHHCGLLRRPGLSWVAYAGAYHVAYLLKVVTGGKPLPADVAGFLGVAQRFLGGGDVYDVACMAGDCPNIPVGLERVAAMLGLAPPLVSPRLAGAGSVLALQAFVALKFGVFGGDVNRYRGLLRGLQVT
ncbi:hypothetical protein ACP70R_043108 [Stipagrostis hirtigluma subsp. patula]